MNDDHLQSDRNVSAEWEEHLIDFTFGAMDPVASAAFERELEVCSAHVTLARRYRDTVAMLGSSVSPAEPPEGHKARLMAKLAATPQAREDGSEPGEAPASIEKLHLVVGARRSMAEREREREHEPPLASAQEERIVDLMQARARRQGSVLAPVLAVAAALALLLMGVWLWTTNNSLTEESNRRIAAEKNLASEQALRLAAEQKLTQFAATLNVPPGYTAFQIQPQPPYTATATVLYNPNTRDASLLAGGLPAPAPGKVYEFWLLPPGTSVSPQAAGTFTPAASGTAMHTAVAPSNVGNYAGFAVTLENAPGAQSPQGPKVLAGTFR